MLGKWRGRVASLLLLLSLALEDLLCSDVGIIEVGRCFGENCIRSRRDFKESSLERTDPEGLGGRSGGVKSNLHQVEDLNEWTGARCNVDQQRRSSNADEEAGEEEEYKAQLKESSEEGKS